MSYRIYQRVTIIIGASYSYQMKIFDSLDCFNRVAFMNSSYQFHPQFQIKQMNLVYPLFICDVRKTILPTGTLKPSGLPSGGIFKWRGINPA